ncbi:MAG: hypothetical protein GX922_00835 [Firmicutes bacterium]|nr:hypothetical protein [Bacillota bacterium]
MFQGDKQKIYGGMLFTLGLLLGLALSKYSPAWQSENYFFRNIAEGADLLAGEAVDDLTYPQELEYQGYLGVYDSHIAIYDGLPPRGVLRHVMLDYEVRDDVRPELEEGIPFTDTYDLLRLLENYTS